nr:D-alanyl-D-alanine carboxypeptidase [bacterium]
MRKCKCLRLVSAALAVVLALALVPIRPVHALPDAIPFSLQSKACVLMDAKTGTVILSKAENERMPIASVTKVMTLLLTFEAIDAGMFTLDSDTQISTHAAGMGGSQVFLDAGQSYKVSDLIRSVIIASGNDAAVALAELVSGTEESFVARMNERAQELGLQNTHFVNPTGLPASGHYSTAYDVAMLSRELIKHEEFFAWSRVWLDELVHPDGRVTTLTNTNRLIRFYDGADGIKTGFTVEAMYCLSATAMRGNQRYIAVILGSPTSDVRFSEIQKLLDYGFAQYASPLLAQKGDVVATIPVKGGQKESVNAVVEENFAILMKREDERNVESATTLPEQIDAPVTQGQVLGQMSFTLAGQEIGKVNLVASEGVPKLSFKFVLLKILLRLVHVPGQQPSPQPSASPQASPGAMVTPAPSPLAPIATHTPS